MKPSLHNRLRLLWVSESRRLHTGFGRTADEVIRRLANEGSFEVGVLGWGMRAGPEGEVGAEAEAFDAGRIPWDRRRIDHVVEAFGPDILLTYGPLSALSVGQALNTRVFVKWVGFGAFEAAPLTEACCRAIESMDRFVVPSVWCQETAEALSPDAPIQYVPLGVDPDVFRPLPERHKLREEGGLGNRFVVGCVARNSFRKQIPILIKAFQRFVGHRPEALLYLHMDPHDAGWPLLQLVRRMGVAEHTLFTRGLAGPLGVDQHQMNRIYNLFDVMVLPTMGEAFGLPVLEAMAAGVPVVATDCSSLPELLRGRGELIAVKEYMTMPWDGAEYALPDTDDLVNKLDLLFGNRELRERYAQRGREFALSMTWDHSADQLCTLIEDLVGRRALSQDAARPRLTALRI